MTGAQFSCASFTAIHLSERIDSVLLSIEALLRQNTECVWGERERKRERRNDDHQETDGQSETGKPRRERGRKSERLTESRGREE